MTALNIQANQTQSVAMTSQMQQAIKILHLNSNDLSEFISEQIIDNPFLENDIESFNDEYNSGDFQRIEDNRVKESLSWNDEQLSPAIYNNETPSYSGVRNCGYSSNSANYYDKSSKKISLKEHIVNQINVDFKSPILKIIAKYLTDLLDDNGYLSANSQNIANILNCDIDDVENTIKKLQKFEPIGVFARDLKECLSIQLKERNKFDPIMAKFLKNLDLYADKKFDRLKKICKINDEDLKQIDAEIKSLNPRPACNFSDADIHVRYPDAFLKRGLDNKWIIELNNEALPKLLINKKYYSEVKLVSKDKVSKRFLSDKLTSASWLVKALDQRANTILKVIEEIVIQQNDFFEKGITYLKPMTLSDISSKIQVHESTVSRAINGKYLATNMGMFELKYFFSSAIESFSKNNQYSNKAIKALIKQFIDDEKPNAVLSDAKIAQMLNNKNINIARRTVVKYRESMNIESSTKRKKAKIFV